MKKLIALAVAAAAMPAMAAVSISGAIEVSYSDKDAGEKTTVAGASVAAQTESTTIATEQATLTVAASSEMDNGMTVSTSYTFKGAGDAVTNDGGEGAITVAGAFGSVSVGDVAGPLDARDGQAAATAENDLSAAFGGDMSLVYTLPTLAEGLNISVGMGEEDGGDTGVANDASGIAFDYSMAGFKVYGGVESSKRAAVTAAQGYYLENGASDTSAIAYDAGDANVNNAGDTDDVILKAAVKGVDAADIDVMGYGASYTLNGLTVAANYAEKEVAVSGGSTTTHEKTAFGVKYVTGNLSLAYNSLEDETDGGTGTTEEASTVSASYNLGGGASVYAASTEKDKSKNDETTVGIKFAF